MESPKYSKKFQKFFVDLARAPDVERRPGNSLANMKGVSGKEVLRVFESRMGLKDLAALQEEWYAWVRSLRTSDIRGVEQAGLRAYREGRSLRAGRLLKEAIDKGSRTMQVHIAYAWILRFAKEEGSREKSLQVLARACEIDPLEPDAWAHRGYFLRAAGLGAEGDRCIALAKEMNPSDDYLWLEIQDKLREATAAKGGGGAGEDGK